MRVRWFSSTYMLRKRIMPTHGPQSWPWWRLVAFRFCRLEVYAPTTGYILWVYTRWGPVTFEVVFDRRPR